MSESDLPRWFEEFYAEALRVGVSRSHALSLYERGEVTAANWLARSRQLQEKAAPGYGIYREQFKTAKSEALKAVGADEEKARGIRALGPVNPMQFSSWPSHLAARWGVGTEAPRHRAALERSEYGEEIIPESHIAWKGREFVYPTSALEASWIGAGKGQITATFPEEKFGKRAAMLGSHERVSITGIPEFRGAIKPGPRAVAPDTYTSVRTAYVIGGEVGTPGTAYIQKGMGQILSEKTQDVYGEDLRPLPVGTRYEPGQEYSLVEGGRGYESPWWGHEIAGVAPITRERKPGEVEHGYRFHMLQTAPVSGPLTAAIKTASGKHIYQETDLSGVVSARTGESLGIQTLQPIKDPGGVAYEMFMAEYSQATPEQRTRIAQQLGFDPNKPPSYGELAAPVMERFSRQASQMVEPITWKGRAYHESQREMFAPVIQKGTEVAAPDIGTGFYRADMQYQAIRANAGQQLMIEYGAKNTPFVSIEMLEQMRRGGPETRALAQQFEGEGARVRNAYRELYRTYMASEGQLQLASGKDIGSRNVQDPKIQAAIQEAITRAEAQGPADRYTMAGRFFEGFKRLRGALPIELEGGVQMLSPRYMSRFSATGVLSEQQVSKLQTSAYEALRWSMIPKVGEEVNPAYRAAIEKYQAAAGEIVSSEKFPTRLEGVHLARGSSYGGTVFSSPLLREGEAYIPQESMQGRVGYLWGHPMQWGTQTWDEQMQRHFITREEAERRGINPELFQLHPTDIQAHARDTDADLMYAKAVAEAQFNEAGQALTTGGAPITNELVNLRAQEAIAAGAGVNLEEMVGLQKGQGGVAPTTEQAAGIMREAWSKPRRFTIKDAWQQLRSFSAKYESIGPGYTSYRNEMAIAKTPEEIAAVEEFHKKSHGIRQRPEDLPPIMEMKHKLRSFTEKGGLFSKQSGVGTTGMAGPGLYAWRGAAINTMIELAKQGHLAPEHSAAYLAPAGGIEELAGVIRDRPEEAYGKTMEMWGGAGPEGLEAIVQGSLIGRAQAPEFAERWLYEKQEGGKRRPRTEQELEAAAMGLGVSPDVARNLLERREEQRAYGEVVGKQIGQRNPLSYLASRAITAARGIIQGSASWLGGGFRTPTDLAGMAMQRAQATAEPAVVQQQATVQEAAAQPVGNVEANRQQQVDPLAQAYWASFGKEKYVQMARENMVKHIQEAVSRGELGFYASEQFDDVDLRRQAAAREVAAQMGYEVGEFGYRKSSTSAVASIRAAQPVGNVEQVAAATKQAKPDVDIPPDIAKRASRARPSSLDFDPSTPEGRAKLTLSLMGLGGKEAAVGTEAHTQIQAAIKGGRSYMGIPSKQWMAESFVTLEGQGGSLDLYSPENQRIVDIKPGSGSFDPANYAYQMAWYGEAGASEVSIGTYDPVLAHQGKWPEMVDKFLGGTPVKPPPITPEQLKERQAAVLQAQQELAPLAAQLLSGMTDEQRKEFAQKPWAEQQEFVMQAMGGSGGGKGPEPPVAIAAGSLAGGGGEQSGGAGRQPPAGPAWATGAWVGMGKIHELEEAKKQLGLWGKAIARNIVDIEHLDKPTKELVQQFEKWSKTFQDVRTESERMGQRIKEYPGAPEDWLKDIRQRMGRAAGAVTGLEGGPDSPFHTMQAAMYEREQLEQYRRVFRATGQAPGGGLFLPGEEFAAEEAAAPRGPRVGRGRRVLTAAEEFYNQLSFGGAYFKLMAAQRIFGRPVDQWEQAASGYTSSQLGFAVEMGAGADVISGSPIGSIAAGQATARTFQMGMGEAGLMSQAGLANIVGRTIGDGSVYGAGRTLGAIATPLMRGAQTGLTAGVLAGAAGKLAPMLGAEFDAAGALVGGTRLGGLAAGLGAASGTIGLVAGGLTALGVAGAYTYQQGEAQNVYRNLIERQGRGLQGPGLIQQAGMAIHSLNPFDYGYEKSVMQGWEELQGSTQLKIAEATVYLEDVDIAGLDPQQKMQLGSFLALGGVTEEEIKSGGARSLLEKMAPMAIAGTLEGATQRTTQLSGALGIAPGAGLRPYWDYMSGLAPTEQQQTVMAGGILGGLGAQIGRTPMLDEIRRYQQALAEGVPEWQLSLQAQTEYGMLPGAQIGGVRAGTSAAQALSGVLAPTSQAQATNQAEIGRGLRQYWDVLGYTEGQMAQQTKESERLVGTGVVSMEQEQRYWQAQSGMLGLAQYYGYGAGTEQAQAFEGQYGNITAQGLARQRTIAQYSGAVGQYRGGNWDYMFGSMVDQGLPSQTLSLIQNQLMGQGAVGQALGGLPGFNNETSLMNMLMNQQLTPQDYGRMAGLAQFGMSQQGYNMMAGGYGLGGPLAQMFGMLEERGMGPGAPTGPALMDAQGYGYGTFERRGINWAQYGLQQRQQEASWEYQQTQNAFQMGDWGGTSSVGWGFGLTGQIQIQQDLMEFTKQIRAITHEMIALQREQSMRGIEYQERGLEMSTRHSLENLGMSRRMWQENTQFSRLQMGVQWGQMETQQGWQMQDMAWNRQMAGFQYEYQQDELERSIRLATGREKQGLLRRREYQEEMYARQEDRRGVEEERAKQVMEWERQKFSLQKEHFERVTQLQEMQFNMQERHILERYALDKEKIEQQKQDMQAIWALEDERRKLQEAWEDRQQQYHLEELERQKRYYEEVVFPYQKQQHNFQLESMKYQAQSMKLQEDIEDAHAKYQAWQIQQYSPGGELYDKVMEFINEIIAALGGVQAESGGIYPDPDDPQMKKTKGTASGGGLAEALFAGLQGASMKLVLDDGKSFDAHIETVQDGADFRRKQAGSWGVPWK